MTNQESLFSQVRNEIMRDRFVRLEDKLNVIKKGNYNFSKDEVIELVFGKSRLYAEYITSNVVAELIYEISSIYKPTSIIDVCCGSGNILSYFKELAVTSGVDINYEAAMLAKYLNPNAQIEVMDFALLGIEGKNLYDLVVAQPPFGYFKGNNKYAEVDIFKKSLELLSSNGIAIFVVADFILNSQACNEFRSYVESKYSVDMIVSLPGGIHGNTSIRTSVIVVRAGGKKNNNIFMPMFDGDSKAVVDSFNNGSGFYVPLCELVERWDRGYYLASKEIGEKLHGEQVVILDNLSEIIRGKVVRPDSFLEKGRYIAFNRSNRDGRIFLDEIPDESCLVRKHDIVVSLIGPNNKIHYQNEDVSNLFITNNYAIIRAVGDRYIDTYLRTEHGSSFFREQINRYLVGGVMPHISISSLKGIEIPIYPLPELNKLVSDSRNKSDLLLESSELVKSKRYEEARNKVELAFRKSGDEDLQHRIVYLDNINNLEQLEIKDREMEEMMSMFAHKFRSPLDTILYNTNHEHQPKLYIQAAQTMRGLLDIFSIISADDIVLIEKLKRDNQGESGLLTVFSKTLDMILLHLLSAQAAEKIQQHYLHYAKKQGLCDAELSYKQWNDDYFELERQLQTEWEQSFAELLSQQATLEQRLAWLEERFFKLELQGFEQANIQFKEYGITESFLTILLNEILVNAFKYYSSDTQQSVVLAWAEGDSYQVLSCRNPSVRNERNRFKGSGKGHTFLSALARKTGSQFTKPKPQDDFVLEFGIANQLLISS